MKGLSLQLILILLAISFITACQLITPTPPSVGPMGEEATGTSIPTATSTFIPTEQPVDETPTVTSTPSPTAAPVTVVTVQWALPAFLLQELGDVLQEQITTLEETFGISILLLPIEGSYQTYQERLFAMSAAGEQLDLFVLYNDLGLAEFNDFLLNISEFSGNTLLDDDFLPGARSSANFDGAYDRGFPWLRWLCTTDYYHLVISNQSANPEIAVKLAEALTSADSQEQIYGYQRENRQVIRWYPTRESVDLATVACSDGSAIRHTVEADRAIIPDITDLIDLNSGLNLAERLDKLTATWRDTQSFSTDFPLMHADTVFQLERARYVLEDENYVARGYIQNFEKECGELSGEIKILVPISEPADRPEIVKEGLILSVLIVGEIKFLGNDCNDNVFTIDTVFGIYLFAETAEEVPFFVLVNEFGEQASDLMQAENINGAEVPQEQWIAVPSTGEFAVVNPKAACPWWKTWCICIEST